MYGSPEGSVGNTSGRSPVSPVNIDNFIDYTHNHHYFVINTYYSICFDWYGEISAHFL